MAEYLDVTSIVQEVAYNKRRSDEAHVQRCILAAQEDLHDPQLNEKYKKRLCAELTEVIREVL